MGTSALRIREIESEADWDAAHGVMLSLRPKLGKAAFLAARERLMSEGYRLIALESGGEIKSIASYVLTPHPVYGRDMQIHDMATMQSERSRGYGRQMLDYLHEVARAAGCGRICVSSRAEREDAHRFYERNGYERYALAFVRPLA